MHGITKNSPEMRNAKLDFFNDDDDDDADDDNDDDVGDYQTWTLGSSRLEATEAKYNGSLILLHHLHNS